MTKYKNDPTEDYDFEPSASDNFWLSQDDQSDESKIYVKELEKKIKEAIASLKELKHTMYQIEQPRHERRIQLIINKLK
jgi:hypothetical protein